MPPRNRNTPCVCEIEPCRPAPAATPGSAGGRPRHKVRSSHEHCCRPDGRPPSQRAVPRGDLQLGGRGQPSDTGSSGRARRPLRPHRLGDGAPPPGGRLRRGQGTLAFPHPVRAPAGHQRHTQTPPGRTTSDRHHRPALAQGARRSRPLGARHLRRGRGPAGRNPRQPAHLPPRQPHPGIGRPSRAGHRPGQSQGGRPGATEPDDGARRVRPQRLGLPRTAQLHTRLPGHCRRPGPDGSLVLEVGEDNVVLGASLAALLYVAPAAAVAT